MYSPTHYTEDQPELVERILNEFGFATLLTTGTSEDVSHLPFITERDSEGRLELWSHMARANPHWRKLSAAGRGKVIFQGPHAYVSPAWYQQVTGIVPTWNYVVVHAEGDFEMVSEIGEVKKAMQKLVGKFESDYETGWQLPMDDEKAKALMKAIVVFKFKNVQLESKFKLSQKLDLTDRENVISELEARGQRELAGFMKKTRSLL